MILPVLSEVLTFLSAWGSQHCDLAAMCLPLNGFKTSLLHLTVLFMELWVRQAYGFAISSVSMAAEIIVSSPGSFPSLVDCQDGKSSSSTLLRGHSTPRQELPLCTVLETLNSI